jgi:asparagine synthase (glutamine-hydrolysing)
MCGIAGVTVPRTDPAIVRRMIDAMHSRGPDDAGCWTDAASTVALGNCRLAIIDLSDAGHMRMSDASQRCWITYNGELYNFRTLRKELERSGHAFHSQTDTEVVLAAYLEWGTECLERLTGMFAFAIHDSRKPEEPKLFLARDRLGIKPLYWARADGGLVFASEIKGMLASGLVDPLVDTQSAWDYLCLGSIPAPRTIVQGVRTLEPGQAMLVCGDDVRRWRYWQPTPPETQGSDQSMEEAAASLRALLEEVVEQHLVADVPVGAFLSGGIDSGGIVALASGIIGRPVRTFTVGFGSGPEAMEELRNSGAVARRYGANHIEVLVSASDVATDFDAIIAAMDQPSVDGVNSYIVSRTAREAVTVALSGLGADELFAGYPHFQRFAQARPLPRAFAAGLRGASAVAERAGPRRVAQALRFAGNGNEGRHAMLREAFSPAARHALCRVEVFPRGLAGSARVFQPLAGDSLDPVTRASVVEIGGYLANTLLRDVDAMSMAHSLEVRVPYIDHRVVEFALALPGPLKLDGGVGKAVLRRALSDLLPAQSIAMPKRYFSMPLEEWVAGPLLPKVREALASRTAERLFRPAALARVLHEAEAGRGARGWASAILAAWMEHHGVTT